MKKIPFVLLLLFISVSCKDKKVETAPLEEQVETTKDIEKPKYPESLTKIFDAHGGLDTWKQMRTLEFSIVKPNGFEITTTDLKERYALVEMPKHTIGFDGESVWMKNDKGANYEGNPKFYYNLMFYFYAMPFVLSDPGIHYSEAKPLTVNDKTYQGVQISFENGVGHSPEDEFILYYDTDSNKMTWLAYTATFGNNEKSTDWQFINYKTWQEVDGLLLPETLTWYHVENNQPTTAKNDLKFSNISLTTDKMNLKIYMMPEGAEAIQ